MPRKPPADHQFDPNQPGDNPEQPYASLADLMTADAATAGECVAWVMGLQYHVRQLSAVTAEHSVARDLLLLEMDAKDLLRAVERLWTVLDCHHAAVPTADEWAAVHGRANADTYLMGLGRDAARIAGGPDRLAEALRRQRSQNWRAERQLDLDARRRRFAAARAETDLARRLVKANAALRRLMPHCWRPAERTTPTRMRYVESDFGKTTRTPALDRRRRISPGSPDTNGWDDIVKATEEFAREAD